MGKLEANWSLKRATVYDKESIAHGATTFASQLNKV